MRNNSNINIYRGWLSRVIIFILLHVMIFSIVQDDINNKMIKLAYDNIMGINYHSATEGRTHFLQIKTQFQ